MIRIELGTWFLINETERFENAVTTITARHITRTDSSFVVTARAEQIPNT